MKGHNDRAEKGHLLLASVGLLQIVLDISPGGGGL